ncbi:unnamed protein product [Trichobilharzia regenti]|nr:unnamed protein product [Trichobilharzia regenti]
MSFILPNFVLSIKGEIRLQTLDMGHCQLTYHSLTSLKSLFGTPGSSITTLIIDHNPMLRNVIISDTQPSPAWIRVLQATTQSASALVSLTIDLPQSKCGNFQTNLLEWLINTGLFDISYG